MCYIFSQLQMTDGTPLFRVRVSSFAGDYPAVFADREEAVPVPDDLRAPVVCSIETLPPDEHEAVIHAVTIGWQGKLRRDDAKRILLAVCDFVSEKHACSVKTEQKSRLVKTLLSIQARLLEARSEAGIISRPLPLLEKGYNGDRGTIYLHEATPILHPDLASKFVEVKLPYWFSEGEDTSHAIFGHGRSPVASFVECESTSI